MELHKFSKIKLRLLEDLDLFDEDIFEREDLGAFLSDSLANLISDELLEKLLKS